MPNRCRSNCFTFLIDGYAFFRLVGVYVIGILFHEMRQCPPIRLLTETIVVRRWNGLLI